MFIGASFLTAPKQKEPKCPSMDEWLNFDIPWKTTQQYKGMYC
jgi:hypothetical protein